MELKHNQSRVCLDVLDRSRELELEHVLSIDAITFSDFFNPQLTPVPSAMGLNSRKRKQAEQKVQPAPKPVQLEMLTDEEDADEVSSDDGEVDEFPEIDTNSDSEEDGDGDESPDYDYSGEEEDSEDVEETEDVLESDTSLHVFPEAKTIVSNITGQHKRVYPDIEPDYDSDSSTEDVRVLTLTPC